MILLEIVGVKIRVRPHVNRLIIRLDAALHHCILRDDFCARDSDCLVATWTERLQVYKCFKVYGRL